MHAIGHHLTAPSRHHQHPRHRRMISTHWCRHWRWNIPRPALGRSLLKNFMGRKAISTRRSSDYRMPRGVVRGSVCHRSHSKTEHAKMVNVPEAALNQGPHQSSTAYTAFLRGEFSVMIRKKQWILLPAALVMTEEELRLSPLRVLPQQDRRPRSIINYTFYLINEDTVVMAPPEAMQFGKELW
jgi:hypothetical protein